MAPFSHFNLLRIGAQSEFQGWTIADDVTQSTTIFVARQERIADPRYKFRSATPISPTHSSQYFQTLFLTWWECDLGKIYLGLLFCFSGSRCLVLKLFKRSTCFSKQQFMAVSIFDWLQHFCNNTTSVVITVWTSCVASLQTTVQSAVGKSLD